MSDRSLVGQTLGRFEILAELGRGGMAVVYQARQAAPNRIVALKVLPPELGYDQHYIARFHQEADSAAALEHPHIVPIYEVGESSAPGGGPVLHYIAMKYIGGQTLKDVARKQGQLGLEQTVMLLEQVALALDYAHSQGVVHRDIKPSNMMIEQSGWVYLTDFGLARGSAASGLTATGTVMGTPEYMSPEQAQGLPNIGPATDIYALGVVAYELLTGTIPFQADTPMGMLVARLQQAPRPPREHRGDLPLPVEDMIMRALARRPEARYASAGAMIAALRRAAGLEGPAAGLQRPISPPQGSTLLPSGLPTQVATPAYVPPTLGPTVALTQSEPARVASAGTPPPAVTPAPRRRNVLRNLLIVMAAGISLMVGTCVILAMIGSNINKQVSTGLNEAQAALAKRGGVERAIAAYERVLEVDSDNDAARAGLALIYNLRNQPEQAEQSARAAITAPGDKDDAPAYAMLAEALNEQGDQQAALEAAGTSVKLDDDLTAAYGALADVKAELARTTADQQLLAEAAADAEQAIKKANDDTLLAQALAHRARGDVYWQAYLLNGDRSDLSRGAAEYNKAIALQDQIAALHADLGFLYDAQGDHERARVQFETALAADPGYSYVHVGLGWNRYALKDWAGALGEFDAALQADQQSADAYIGKSAVFQAQEPPDHDQAIEALQRASAVAPERLDILVNLGWAYRLRAASLAFGSDQQQSGYADAETYFRKAITPDSRYIEALTGLGWVLQDQGAVLKQPARYQDALKLLKRSLELKEQQPYAHSALGWSLLGLHQYEAAAASFLRATELQEGYADAFYGLGQALGAQAKTEEARQAYQKAIEYGSQAAQTALDQLK